MLHRHAIGRGREHHVVTAAEGFFVRLGEGEADMAAQILEKIGDLSGRASPREVITRTSTCGCTASRRNNSTPV